jgi:hypothetical protein
MAGTRRRKIAPRPAARITPEAIAAWQGGDYWGLWHALGLKLWQMPDWDEDPPDEPWTVQPLPYGPRAPDPTALKAALIAVAGPPPQRWFYRND